VGYVSRASRYSIILIYAPTQHRMHSVYQLVDDIETDKLSHRRSTCRYYPQIKMAGEAGIEPATRRLTVVGSAAELLAKIFSRLSIFNPSAKRILISAIDCILGIFTYEAIGPAIRTRTATNSFGDCDATNYTITGYSKW
jgi:hypothetical protein